MWTKQHNQISWAALKGLLTSQAMDVIYMAQHDSDGMTRGGGASFNVQHFHYKGDVEVDNHKPEDLVKSCSRFIYDCRDFAEALVLYQTEPLHVGLALYFLGRGLHCAQDYYAHSNGVSIMHVDPTKVLDPKCVPRNMKFCLPTKSSWGGLGKLMANKQAKTWTNTKKAYKDRISYDDVSPGELRKLCREANLVYDPNKLTKNIKQLRLVMMLRRRNPAMLHQHLHLDFPNSLADNAMKNILGFGYARGADYAKSLTYKLCTQLMANIADPNRQRVNTLKDKVTRFNAANKRWKPLSTKCDMDLQATMKRLREFREFKTRKALDGLKKSRRELFNACMRLGKFAESETVERGDSIVHTTVNVAWSNSGFEGND